MTEITKIEPPVDEMTRLRNLYADMDKIIRNPQEPKTRRDEARTQRLNIYIKMQKLASSTNQNNIFQKVPIPNTDAERVATEMALAAEEARNKRIDEIRRDIDLNEKAMAELPPHCLAWERGATISMSLRQKLNDALSGRSDWTGKP